MDTSKVKTGGKMTLHEIETEIELLAIMLFTTQDQILMVQGHLKYDAKKTLGVWQKLGEKLLNDLNMKINAPYYGELTDVLHQQLDEIRKTLMQLKKIRANEKG